MSEHTFTDPLDEIMARHSGNIVEENKTEIVDTIDTDVEVDMPINIPERTVEFDDIDYGDDDLANEIKETEEREAAERAEAIRQHEEAEAEAKSKITQGAPNPYDMNKHAEDMGFQTENLSVVSMMLNKVIAKHHIISGCIPDDKKMAVMGDLLSEYYKNGDTITPEFEKIILDNWIGANDYVEEDKVAEETEIEEKDNKTVEPQENDYKININVEPGTPVTVNIDGEAFDEVERRREINVIVHEVDEKEMRSSTIIENSQLDGIITPYESSATDVPLTLPMSAYRCTMGGVSMFDLIKLSAIQNGNPRDMDIKIWTLIYNHLKNSSIGTFKSFDDFLKHTDYRDMELLLWGAFVATADEVETISFTCGNPKCKYHMDFKYSPRTIIHVDENLIPDHYNTTHTVASGKDAIEHWESVHSKKRIYELPISKVLIELDDYSAWDYHNIKMPLMQKIYNRYRPDDKDIDMNELNDEEANEMNFLLMFLLYIKAVTINKNGKSYRYTNWNDIEKIITSHIGNKDLSILISIINQVKNVESPISFYLQDVKCPKCGRKDDKIPVNDIMRSLFFQLSSGLNNTTINFVETQKI